MLKKIFVVLTLCCSISVSSKEKISTVVKGNDTSIRLKPQLESDADDWLPPEDYEVIHINKADLEQVKKFLQNKDLTKNDIKGALGANKAEQKTLSSWENKWNKKGAAPESYKIIADEHVIRNEIDKLLNDWLATHK